MKLPNFDIFHGFFMSCCITLEFVVILGHQLSLCLFDTLLKKVLLIKNGGRDIKNSRYKLLGYYVG